MHRLSHGIFAVAVLLGANVTVVPGAKAVGVNCSHQACVKQCVAKGTTPNGCSKWCGDAMVQRRNAGQCKK